MTNAYLGLKFALSYFTLLPIRFGRDDDLSHPRVLEAMLLTLPLVGVLLSSLSIGLAEALHALGWLGALIAAVAYMALYGFIHTEAVIDVADAVHAAHGGKDPYTVIKEPTVGAMGVLYGAAFLLLKTAVLTYLLLHRLYLPFLAIAMLSRLNLAILIHAFAFRSSFVTALRAGLRRVPLAGAALLYTAAGVTAGGAPFLLLASAGLAVSLGVFVMVRRTLGFANGDLLGTSLEVTELLLMLGVLIAWF